MRNQILKTGPGFVVGRFRCDPVALAWRTENRIGSRAVLAFPTIPVTIRHEGGPRRTADRTRVMLYNPGQVYERGLVHPIGDRCVFIELCGNLATRFAARLAGSEVPDRFDRDHTHAPESVCLTVRRLAADHEAHDPDNLEEIVLGLLGEISSADPSRPNSESRRTSTLEAHRDLVEASRAELATSFTRTDSLSDIAGRLHTSPFHLARIFREHTGRSVVEHRRTLRARASLEMLLDSELPIATIAHRVGYPSHAQFSAAFGRVFGRSPMSAREAGRPRAARFS
ncbi:MAG: AraC-like DNA-binding protein [Phycisphaerales bacterium]